MHRLFFGIQIILMCGCASQAVIQNKPHSAPPVDVSYSMQDVYGNRAESDLGMILTFSGGGSRAAALAYGVLLELRDTIVHINGRPKRLLDDVNVISSVSGGSFTAAYYGLYGDRIFTDFESRFLRRDFEGELIRWLLSPSRWLTGNNRTEMAVEYYQNTLFGDATFAQMRKHNAPMIMINASDLSTGARFSFSQEYFNLLCSDIDSFPVAKAVAASSAVPVLFAPIVVENYQNCDVSPYIATIEKAQRETSSLLIRQVAAELERIVRDKHRFRYLHLVDGGLTDNLGVRALYEIIELYGGAKPFLEQMGFRHSKKSALIVVNASTNTSYGIADSSNEPNLEQTVNAMSDIQVHRYNVSTLELIQRSLRRWYQELYSPEQQTDPYFIEINLQHIQSREETEFINQIPTGFALSDDQVDALIKAGRQLLRHHPLFIKLVASLNDPSVSGG